jgi:NAD(P)-dependent dehydrogenase (short-subunit alcohol dehydrogenase family)
MGRFGRPEDLIAATVFLLSPGSAFMTGQVLYVDGGRTID